jgi:protein-L-isoaspartate O-methyltransferase
MTTATYSPDDNKLRLYSTERLDPETYAKVKAHGFKWAPKQELFVAPMWTPEREDLLLELCGEVGDEDTTLAERAEQRAERFDEYSDNRREDAERARKSVDAIASHIPFGQPILVGHHSEKHARKDAERIENGMRRTVKMWEQSEYWKSRAAGAVRAASYKERPDVRARRIKGIEADKRKRVKCIDDGEYALRFWRGELKLKSRTTGETRPLVISEENRVEVCSALGNLTRPGNPGVCRHPTLNQFWSAWDVLKPDGERYRDCPSMTVEECRLKAEKVYTAANARHARWVSHYDHRLAYERAMLAADGGTVADKIGPEVGGACRCLVNRGWSKIQKVNKVSVTLLDNWGNTNADGSPTRDFTRIIPFDKLAGIMSKADVDIARLQGRVRAETARAFELADATPPKPKAEPVKDAAAEETGEAIDAMRATLKAGVQVVVSHQLFPTPPALAERLVALADIRPKMVVLEPSAGTGNILTAICKQGDGLPVAVEINAELVKRLKGEFPITPIHCADFLTFSRGNWPVDRIVMNPPFERGADIAHIRHALTMLKPGGRLVAICANGPRQQEELQPICDEWIELEPGAFKESGTMVNTAICVITR